jgi:fluoroquinolone transport system ATP-binding protein
MIEVSELEYHYPGSPSAAVRRISFGLQPGEIFGFLGPSGAGKSTTQKILIKLLEGYQGSIRVLGKPLENWGSSYYNHIGVGFELPNHFGKLTALENLRFFGTFYDRPPKKPLDLLAMVGLENHAHQRASEFSKGMKMRLNFVRALMHGPELLFLDEPTSGLDPVNARRIKDIILQLRQAGTTIFLTTHQMHDAEELCDRVAFIVDGAIKLIGSPRELKQQHGQRSVKVAYQNGSIEDREFPLDGLSGNAEFQRILREERLLSIHSREASLDDIFIKVTGKSLE